LVAALTPIRKLPGPAPLVDVDRGLEMAKHKTFTVATDVKSISVIRKALGSVARTKTRMGIATILPKRTDLSGYSQSDLDKVALRLNQRPRKTLGFQTPASRSKQVLRRPIETPR